MGSEKESGMINYVSHQRAIEKKKKKKNIPSKYYPCSLLLNKSVPKVKIIVKLIDINLHTKYQLSRTFFVELFSVTHPYTIPAHRCLT